ncbi:MAG: LptF/LptG family permease [Bacteroidota bacterium]
MRLLGYKKIDGYIIRKFLGTFFYAITLIISLSIIFDLSEKLDDFLNNNVMIKEIVFDYYLNFAPYFAVLFSSMFTFISVIYFTSRMAYNSEVIAILSNGISLNRLLFPYLTGAMIIAVFAFSLHNFVLPYTNKRKLVFEEKYNINTGKTDNDDRHIHRQVEPGVFIYLEHFYPGTNSGKNFSIERFENGKLTSKLLAKRISWDSTSSKWTIYDYYIRNIDDLKEEIIEGKRIDSTMAFSPGDFHRKIKVIESMTLGELTDFIEEQKMQGITNVVTFLIEKHRRYASPYATFILTIIGMTVSMRKLRGGIGAQIGIGLALVFIYIISFRFSSQFAIGEGLDPMLATWLPNIIFSAVALVMLKLAPK